MNRTLTLRLANTAARGEIARQAVVALAVRVGMPPLAADRAAARVGAAVASCPGEVVLEAVIEAGSARLELSGGDAAWRTEAAAALEELEATAVAGAVVMRLVRTPLRSV